MDFYEINFNKKNRRPITETTYQIDASEWNALGKKVSEIDSRNNENDKDGFSLEASWDNNEYSEYPIL